MGTRPILQVLKIFQVFFPVPVQVQCERFLLKPYNPFFQVPVLTLGRTALLLPSATKLRPVNVFTPVCHSVHRGESAIAPPLGRHPLWAANPRHTPHRADTPRVQCMLGYSQQAGSTHPTGMQSHCRCNGLHINKL